MCKFSRVFVHAKVLNNAFLLEDEKRRKKTIPSDAKGEIFWEMWFYILRWGVVFAFLIGDSQLPGQRCVFSGEI